MGVETIGRIGLSKLVNQFSHNHHLV